MRIPSLRAMFSYDSALGQVSGGADYKVVVFELNANRHDQGRALGNALAIGAAERGGRLPIVTSANCLQPDGQNDNGWDQGLLFLNPGQVWLQPPGYVTQMFSHNYLPLEVENTVNDPNNDLYVTSESSADESRLVLKVVNLNGAAENAAINLGNYVPTNPVATVEELAAPLTATNTAGNPTGFSPAQLDWNYHYTNKMVNFMFPATSVTTIAFQGILLPSPPAVLAHRYSFNGSPGNTVIADLAGNQSGQFIGSSGGLDGNGNLILNGVDGYVDLGPDLISNDTSLTVESWVNVSANDATYARLFDFTTRIQPPVMVRTGWISVRTPMATHGLRFLTLIQDLTGRSKFWRRRWPVRGGCIWSWSMIRRFRWRLFIRTEFWPRAVRRVFRFRNWWTVMITLGDRATVRIHI